MKYSSQLLVSTSIVAGLIILIILAPESEGAISCSDVIKDLKPCVNYLKSGSGNPPSDCCTGASALASATSSSADKKAACSCIKTAAQKMTINSKLAQALPGNCGITLSVPISPNVDCSSIG